MVQERMVQGWQVWKCFNCCIDVCAIDLNNSVALVNMDMEVFYLVLHPHHVSSFFFFFLLFFLVAVSCIIY